MDLIAETARTASAELRARSAELSEEIVARQYAMQPELWKPYGERGRQISIRGGNSTPGWWISVQSGG